MRQNAIAAGDFSGLASDYSKNRPDYAPSVLNGLIGLLNQPFPECRVADVGAGTGIWTRMLAQKDPAKIWAIEPNDSMRSKGIADSQHLPIQWAKGGAESTGLENETIDWLTMASSFHWADFESALREFHRVLRPGGRFTALWNPRLIEVNPLLVEIEAHLDTLRSDIKRVSSGRSGITEQLTERLWENRYFDDVVYLEGRHVIMMSSDRYLGAWRSVNDLQAQLGPKKFDEFIRFIEQRIADYETIEATYWTRAWSARCVK